VPATANLVVITPERMRVWLNEIDEGRRTPKAYFGYSEPSYLNFAQWLQSIVGYINAQNEVISAYEREAKQHNFAIEQPPPSEPN